jgi:hypothetical protein
LFQGKRQSSWFLKNNRRTVMNADEERIVEIQVDQENLYREEFFTDFKAVSIRRLIPVKIDGAEDKQRKDLYFGQTQLMSPRGPVPVHCSIEADSLKEAMDKFPDAIEGAVKKMIAEAREMEREQASKIVIPGA